MQFKDFLSNPTAIATLVLGTGLVVYGTASVAAPKLLVMYKVTSCISSPVECFKTVFNQGSANSASEVQDSVSEPVVVESKPAILLRYSLTPEQCMAIRTGEACDLYFERNNAN
jgi:hypothetical protein